MTFVGLTLAWLTAVSVTLRTHGYFQTPRSTCQLSFDGLFPTCSASDQSVIQAEGLFANFVVEHNLPFMVADHFTHHAPVMFPGSKTAKAFSSAKMKTTCIVKDAMHPHFVQHVIEQCRAGPFSIMCDEGSDKASKNIALLVRLWDEKLGKLVTRFLDMPVCNIVPPRICSTALMWL